MPRSVSAAALGRGGAWLRALGTECCGRRRIEASGSGTSGARGASGAPGASGARVLPGRRQFTGSRQAHHVRHPGAAPRYALPVGASRLFCIKPLLSQPCPCSAPHSVSPFASAGPKAVQRVHGVHWGPARRPPTPAGSMAPALPFISACLTARGCAPLDSDVFRWTPPDSCQPRKLVAVSPIASSEWSVINAEFSRTRTSRACHRGRRPSHYVQSAPNLALAACAIVRTFPAA